MNDAEPVTERDIAETSQPRQRAWEAQMIAEARADFAAGRVVDGAALDALLNSLGADDALPVRPAGR